MSIATPLQPATTSLALSSARFADYVQLARPRIALMVLITVGLGGWLAAIDRVPVETIFHALIGTALVTASASALNQYLERDTDARMTRTMNRPLPAGRLAPAEVLALGVALAIIGLTYQALTLPIAAFAVTAFTLVSYIFVYTPSKTRTNLNTLIGAVPGALPPVIGWAAVRGTVDYAGLTLFLILFFWQVPHFLAIAWMYRDEYARAGHKMLTVDDATGHCTARQMIVYLLALAPVSLLAGQALGAGWAYSVAAIVLAAYFLRPALAFRREASRTNARSVLTASLVYLPGILGLLLIARYVPNF